MSHHSSFGDGSDRTDPVEAMRTSLEEFTSAGREVYDRLGAALARVPPGPDTTVTQEKARVVAQIAAAEPQIFALQLRLHTSAAAIWKLRRAFNKAVASGSLSNQHRQQLISARNQALDLLHTDAVEYVMRHQDRSFDIYVFYRMRNPLPGALTPADAQRWILRDRRERERRESEAPKR
jgi:tRNA A37 threonylcarbamoyladenosine synthetase subunit TsaC/SUA5/YrdC